MKYGIDKRLGTVCIIYLYSIIPKMSFSFFCNLLNPEQKPQTPYLPQSLCSFSDFLTCFVTNFENETTARKFYEICTGMRFVSIFFLTERDIRTSLLMMHLKCTVVRYANLNSSSIKKPFSSFFAFSFNFLFIFILTRLNLWKTLWKKTIILNKRF